MGEDQHAADGERRVAADVIGVHVGVDEEADLTIRELAHRGNEVLGVRLELRVDEQHTLFADEDADVCEAVGPLDHVHVAGDRHGIELHIKPKLKLGGCGEPRQIQDP